VTDRTETTVGQLSKGTVDALLALGISDESEASSAAGLCLYEMTRVDSTGVWLQTLVSDLNCSILQPENGPLSFSRLTGIDDRIREELARKTFLGALAEPDTSREALRHLAEYAELLVLQDMPKATRLAGEIIRAFAVGALAMWKEEVHGSAARMVVPILLAVTETAVMPKPLRERAVDLASQLSGD